MVSAFPFSARFPLGTLVAEIGVIVVGAYYWVGWRSLNKISATRALSELPFPLAKPPWPELRYLRWGIFLSVAIFMVAGAADAVGDWLFMLAGSLLGFCAALFFAMLGVGFVALFHLWKELVPQFRRANIWSLLLSSPLAIFWLALGLVVMVFLGMIIDRVPVFGQFVFFKALIWGVISIALYRLWMGRSHAALVLRAILMFPFLASSLAPLRTLIGG